MMNSNILYIGNSPQNVLQGRQNVIMNHSNEKGPNVLITSVEMILQK